jgi:hypothetical protein
MDQAHWNTIKTVYLKNDLRNISAIILQSGRFLAINDNHSVTTDIVSKNDVESGSVEYLLLREVCESAQMRFMGAGISENTLSVIPIDAIESVTIRQDISNVAFHNTDNAMSLFTDVNNTEYVFKPPYPLPIEPDVPPVTPP